MFNKLRYTSSSFFAAVLTLITFVGMSLLIAPSDYRKSMDLEIGDFSTIRDMKAPELKTQPVKKIPPKQEQVKQPPVAPALKVPKSYERDDIKLPQGLVKTNISEISDNMMPKIILDKGLSTNRDLRSTVPVQPMYPIKQVMNKTEGWVKVEFTVNEFGNVINASVIDSQPARVFNAAALKAIKKSKFKPLIVNGKAVSQTATQVYEFKLEKNQ